MNKVLKSNVRNNPTMKTLSSFWSQPEDKISNSVEVPKMTYKQKMVAELNKKTPEMAQAKQLHDEIGVMREFGDFLDSLPKKSSKWCKE